LLERTPSNALASVALVSLSRRTSPWAMAT
jgi:hypothetical protein